MFFSRCVLLLAALLLTGLSEGVFAAQSHPGSITKEEKSLRGTWYSAKGSITFKDNGTINYKGKRYFYAISNGGIIQLRGKHSSKDISYQIFGDELTLAVDGQTVVYSRHRRGGK